MQIAIFGSRHQDRHLPQLQALLQELLALGTGVEIMLEERFYSYIAPLINLSAYHFTTFTRLSVSPTIALSIGGDGTFLRVAKAVGRLCTPIMGINTGHLGYLAAASIDNPTELVQHIVSGDYSVERRAMLKVECPDAPLPGARYALNEVALLRRDTASMITLHASLGAEPLASYRGDGLIISTPTGSTGYNLSVGGPIVGPYTPCLIIAPIAPHSLNMRPIVVSDRHVVGVTPEGRSDTLLLSIDGKAAVIPMGARITVTRARFDACMVVLPGHSFISTIREKLLWGSINA